MRARVLRRFPSLCRDCCQCNLIVSVELDFLQVRFGFRKGLGNSMAPNDVAGQCVRSNVRPATQ